ncbi:MAG: 2-amino-4-hydroxy-6-hydroxymethyldihydropteridine diphosphokinase, partial [Janthinobacterium lividum]
MSATVHIALGSNRRHGRYGPPSGVVVAAVAALDAAGLRVVARSRIHTTAPVGPSDRAFANAVVAVETILPPGDLLRLLKAIEAAFGRRRGRRWGARVLDLDIVAAEESVVPSRLRWRAATAGLIVPHRGLALRSFVLDPL